MPWHIKRLSSAILSLCLLHIAAPDYARAQASEPINCVDLGKVTITSNLSYNYWKQGSGILALRFIAPSVAIGLPLDVLQLYSPKSIEVRGPGSRPWVASGDFLAECRIVLTGPEGGLIVAAAVGFAGEAWQTPAEGDCELETLRSSETALLIGQGSSLENDDCSDWGGEGGGGGGGGGTGNESCWEIWLLYYDENGALIDVINTGLFFCGGAI